MPNFWCRECDRRVRHLCLLHEEEVYSICSGHRDPLKSITQHIEDIKKEREEAAYE